MTIVATFQRLASAACVFFGRHGSVSEQARLRGVQRQTLYRQADEALDRVEGSSVQQQVQHLRQDLLDCQQRLLECQRQLQQRQPCMVVLDDEMQAHFAACGQAEGVSLPVLTRLLRVFLGDATPSVATLGRLSQDAAVRSSALLAILDEHAGPLAQQACADELYCGRKPVLMAVEPDSLCWLSGRLSDKRDAAEWLQEFQRLPALQQVNRDGAEGLRKGLKLFNKERRKQGKPAVADHLDHFHTLRDGSRALRREQNRVARALKKAEEASQRDARCRRRGKARPGGSGAACHKWRKAEQAFDTWSAQDDVWSEVKQTLQLFTPQGELNSRQRAEALLAAACARLPGAHWDKTRRQLAAAETLTFLDRAHQRLAALPFDPAVVQAAVRLEGVRRHPELVRGTGAAAAVSAPGSARILPPRFLGWLGTTGGVASITLGLVDGTFTVGKRVPKPSSCALVISCFSRSTWGSRPFAFVALGSAFPALLRTRCSPATVGSGTSERYFHAAATRPSVTSKPKSLASSAQSKLCAQTENPHSQFGLAKTPFLFDSVIPRHRLENRKPRRR